MEERENRVRARHRLGPDVPLVFVESTLGDASNFFQRPLVHVGQEDGRFIILITRCVSVAHVLAAAAHRALFGHGAAGNPFWLVRRKPGDCQS